MTPPQANAGLSLIELLVVLAVVGLAATAVLLTLPDDRADLHRQAETFGRQLGHARDQAIVSGQPLRVVADTDGYRFERHHDGHWERLQQPPFAAHRWREGVHAALPPGSPAVAFRFDPVGVAEPARLELARGADRVAITIDPAGQVSLP